MSTKKTALIMLVLATALLAVLAAPAPAGAYCIYNHTNTSLAFQGGTCMHCMQRTINKGDKGCCQGDKKGCRGHTRISFTVDYDHGYTCNNFYVPKDVEAHGWVSLFGSCRKDWDKCNQADACEGVTAKVHDRHGNVTYSGKVRQSN